MPTLEILDIDLTPQPYKGTRKSTRTTPIVEIEKKIQIAPTRTET